MMRRLVVMVGTGCLVAWAASAAPAVKKAAGYSFKNVTVEIRHRVFHDFLERDTGRPGVLTQVGDTDYKFKVLEYVPDFAMELKSGKVISRSTEPNNPAFHIQILLKGKPQDTTWAMLKMPPHFARKSLLAFKVMRIELPAHAPIVNPDTLPPAPEPARPAAAPKGKP